MAFQILGADGVTVIAGDAASKALRITPRPIDVGTLGSYSIGLATGVMAAALAANSEIVQFRWADATRLCLVRVVTISAAVNTTAFTAAVGRFEMRAARAWSAAGSGGTRTTFGTNDSKRKTGFGQSIITASDVGISTTAALTAGTKTLDGTSLNDVTFPCTTAGSLMLAPYPLWSPNFSGEWPLVLGQNEGFVIRVPLIAATGTWTASVAIEWTELASFQ